MSNVTTSIQEVETSIRSLSKAQRDALDSITMGQPNGASRRTMLSLVHRGLLGEISIEERTAMGTFSWTQHAITPLVHMVWASVCAAEYDALSQEEKAALAAPDNVVTK